MSSGAKPYISASITLALGAAAIGFWRGADALYRRVLQGEVEGGHFLVTLICVALSLTGAVGFFIGCWWTWQVWRESRWDLRAEQDRCGRCGYDLRSSRDRCPECGYPIFDRR